MVTAPPGLRLAELLGALSHALDITEGQPPGHCVRCCWIGMHIGREAGLAEESLWELYYTLLLKDLGCSSNAARICELYLADDLRFKRDFKQVGNSLPDAMRFVVTHTGLRAGLADRYRAIVNILENGGQIARELIQTRCRRGASIARQLRFPEGVAEGIHGLDEHWDGSGKPDGLPAELIPVESRIALISQVVDVFRTSSGPEVAMAEVRSRSGTWLDPHLVGCFLRVAQDPGFWAMLASDSIDGAVFALEPAQHTVALDDDYLDDIAAAFGQVVDAKSPYTSGHSTRVARYAVQIAARLGMQDSALRWLRRVALLHDLGKLGVSNSILDKPGKLDREEWEAVQRHAGLTQEILGRIRAFDLEARIAGAHHERIDGRGYPLGLQGNEIAFETRIITTADIFDALTAARPYRGAMAPGEALDIMRRMLGSALDPVVFAALEAAVPEVACA
jgi:HD-GYP domain-containing protein (c-di-GMP phosphodiesterase class II)